MRGESQGPGCGPAGDPRVGHAVQCRARATCSARTRLLRVGTTDETRYQGLASSDWRLPCQHLGRREETRELLMVRTYQAYDSVHAYTVVLPRWQNRGPEDQGQSTCDDCGQWAEGRAEGNQQELAVRE